MVNIWLLYGYYMDIIWLVMVPNNLVGGFNLPLWKMMEFVSWDDDIPNIWKNIQVFLKPPTRLESVDWTLSYGDVNTEKHDHRHGILGIHGYVLPSTGFGQITSNNVNFRQTMVLETFSHPFSASSDWRFQAIPKLSQKYESLVYYPK